MERMTKRDYFNALLMVDGVRENAELTGFINKELELLDRKRAAKSEKPENILIVNTILGFMTPTDVFTVTEICDKIRELTGSAYSTQKIAPIMTKLYEENKVKKTIEKKRVFWTGI